MKSAGSWSWRDREPWSRAVCGSHVRPGDEIDAAVCHVSGSHPVLFGIVAFLNDAEACEVLFF